MAQSIDISRQRAWALALVATFTMAVSYFDRQTLAVLAPSVTADLKLSETQYGWLASAFSIAYLVGAPLAGFLIDRVGARRGLPWSVGIWSLVAAMHALAPGFGALFALRIALGLAESPSFPGAAQTVQRVLPEQDRPRGFGVLFTGSSFGAMIIPPVASWLLGAIGWRGAFVGTALIGLIWIPVWMIATSHPASKALLSGAGAASGERRASLATVIAHPAVLRAAALVIAAAPALAFIFLWESKYLVRRFAIAPADVGQYLWLPPLFLDLGSVVFGELAARRRRSLAPGQSDRLLVALAALLTMGVALTPLADSPWAAMIAAGMTMAGGGGLFALLTGDMLSRVSPGVISAAGGTTAAAQSIAYVIASPLIGWSVDRFGGYSQALIALAIWVVPGALLWILWEPKSPRAP